MLTLNDAKKVIEAAQKKAEELDIKISVVVVDTNGIMIAMHKMDGALSVSPKFAGEKAYTAGTIGLPTAGMAEYATPGKPYFGVDNLDGGVFTTIAGGQPLKKGDKVIGGVGVGGSYDTSQDNACATAGVAALA
jgi:uncharacterized protein GlcG (DUF336 family)